MTNNVLHSIFLFFSFSVLISLPCNGFSESKNHKNDVQNQETKENWQVLEWGDDSLDYVLYYEVIIQSYNTGTKNYEDERTLITEDNTPSVKIRPRLAEGRYRFKVVSYNLVDVPVTESDWENFTIYKAQMPEVSSISTETKSKNTIFLEDLKDDTIMLTVKGSNLFAPKNNDEEQITFTDYKLVNLKKREKEIIPDVVETSSDGTQLKIKVDSQKLEPGEYSLIATDASGLTNELGVYSLPKNALKVKFTKDFGFDLSLGFTPALTLHDMSFKEYTGSQIWPLGANVRMTFLPIKKMNNYFGFGVTASYARILSKKPLYELGGNLLIGHLNFVYQKPFRTKKNRKIVTLDFHGGVGCVFFNDLKFKYSTGGTSESFNSLSLSFDAGIAAQIYITKHLYGELCVDYVIAPFSDLTYGVLLPSASIGWQF